MLGKLLSLLAILCLVSPFPYQCATGLPAPLFLQTQLRVPLIYPSLCPNTCRHQNSSGGDHKAEWSAGWQFAGVNGWLGSDKILLYSRLCPCSHTMHFQAKGWLSPLRHLPTPCPMASPPGHE